MKNNRLKELYQRRLVRPETSGRRFPLEYTLRRELGYFPARPDQPDYDILEIGPGTGDFLFHLAATYPDKKILGIELGRTRFFKISQRLTKRAINNVTLIAGDARAAFYKDLTTATFNKIFVLFPDPWPKTRHSHHRLLTREFLTVLATHLCPGGEFTLATDVLDYANWVSDNLREVPALINTCDTQYAASLPDLIPTFFEQKWRRMGRGFWFVRYRKV